MEDSLAALEATDGGNAAVKHLRVLERILNGQWQDAVERMDALSPDDPWNDHSAQIWSALAALYRATGADPLAAEYAAMVEVRKRIHFDSSTITHYGTPLNKGLFDEASEVAWAQAVYDYTGALVNAQRRPPPSRKRVPTTSRSGEHRDLAGRE